MTPEFQLWRTLKKWRRVSGDSFSEGMKFDAQLGYHFMEYEDVEQELRSIKQSEQNGIPR